MSNKLFGFKCNDCEQLFLEKVNLCWCCGSQKAIEKIPIPSKGKIVAFTVVWRGAPHLPTPYTLAVIEVLDDLKLLGRMEQPEQKLSVGQNAEFLRKDQYGLLFKEASAEV